MVNSETAILDVAIRLNAKDFNKTLNTALTKSSNVMIKELNIQQKILNIVLKKAKIEDVNQNKAIKTAKKNLFIEDLIFKKKEQASKLQLLDDKKEMSASRLNAQKSKITDTTPQVAGLLDRKELSNIKNYASDFDYLNKTIGFTANATEAAQLKMMLYGKSIGLTTDEIKQFSKTGGKSFDEVIAKTKKLKKVTQEFNFDFLSLIFGGMMLTSTFGGAIKSIASDYKRLTEGQDDFSKSVMGLQAEFNYLKFTIAGALNQPFVIDFIDSVSDRMEYLADVISDNPEMATWIMGIMVALAATGLAAQIAGNVQQVGLMGKALRDIILTDVEQDGVKSTILNLKSLKKIGVITISLAVTAAGLASINEYIKKTESGAEAWKLMGEAIKDTINDALDPAGIALENIGEIMILAGVSLTKMIAGFMQFVEVGIMAAKIVKNLVDMFINYEQFKWDLVTKGPSAALKNIKDNTITDITDIETAWDEGWENIMNYNKIIGKANYQTALDEYRDNDKAITSFTEFASAQDLVSDKSTIVHGKLVKLSDPTKVVSESMDALTNSFSTAKTTTDDLSDSLDKLKKKLYSVRKEQEKSLSGIGGQLDIFSVA